MFESAYHILQDILRPSHSSSDAADDIRRNCIEDKGSDSDWRNINKLKKDHLTDAWCEKYLAHFWSEYMK